ncbi:MAG: DUF2059 domain-containing protein [Rhizobiales bacterium]|nr:DUF2059 domain-containing protein [Hyphomicrobiales bacterium]
MRAPIFGAFAALYVLMVSHAALAADPTPSHVKAAREMLALTEADKMFNGVLPVLLKQQIGVLEKSYSNVTNEVAHRFETLFLSEAQKGIDQAMDKVAVAYAEALTEGELNEISAFYKSPVGRKMIKIKPEMGQRALKIGIEWGQDVGTIIGKKVVLQMKAEGLKF